MPLAAAEDLRRAARAVGPQALTQAAPSQRPGRERSADMSLGSESVLRPAATSAGVTHVELELQPSGTVTLVLVTPRDII